MKILKNLSIYALLALMITTISCGDDDEPKDTPVEDLAAPAVTINSPTDGATVETLDETTTVTIKFEATDDVELASVVVDFDATQISETTSFTDFLKYVGEVSQANVADGEHTIKVTATDLSGKSTSATTTFTKSTANPYTALDGEVAYWPFDGNYAERISEVEATVVGTPSFAGAGKVGSDAYKGAAESYLTFSTDNIKSATTTISFYINVNADPERGGILVMGPPDPDNTDFQNKRTSGIRIFREPRGTAGRQVIKANFGTGEAEHWLDGGDLATVDPAAGEWAHFALVIDATTATFYLNGAQVAKTAEHVGLSFAGCDILSIMSGQPRFTEWGHGPDQSSLDELKIFNKALTEAELETLTGLEFGLPAIEDPADPGLTPIDGADATEVLYMSFDADFSVTGASVTATTVGTPSVVDGGVSGKAYKGDVNSYLTLPTTGLLNDNFSASMWIKMDPTATRAGILTINAVNATDAALNNLSNGFRLFREGDDLKQTFKMNVGTGAANAWVDGGAFATFAADRDGWLHLAITVGGGKSQVYLNGILAAVSAEDLVVDWTGCDLLSFGSGAPRFQEWGHIGETGLLDELRIYNGILTPAQIATLKAVGN